MKTLHLLLIIYAVMSVIGFALMGIDKSRAINHKWRIKEATLFRRRHRLDFGHVLLSPQDKALVFPPLLPPIRGGTDSASVLRLIKV